LVINTLKCHTNKAHGKDGEKLVSQHYTAS